MPKALWRVKEATDVFTLCLRCSHVHLIRVQLLLFCTDSMKQKIESF